MRSIDPNEIEQLPTELTSDELASAMSIDQQKGLVRFFNNETSHPLGVETRQVVEMLENAFDSASEQFFKNETFVDRVVAASHRMFEFIKERGVKTVVLLDKSARFDWVVLDAFAKEEGYPLAFNFMLPDHLDKTNQGEISWEYPDLMTAREPILVLDEETASAGLTVEKARSSLAKTVSVPVYAGVLGSFVLSDATIHKDDSSGQTFLTPDNRVSDTFEPARDVFLATDQMIRSIDVMDVYLHTILPLEFKVQPTPLLRETINKIADAFSHGLLTGGVLESEDKERGVNSHTANRGPWWARSIARRFREGYRNATEIWIQQHKNGTAAELEQLNSAT